MCESRPLIGGEEMEGGALAPYVRNSGAAYFGVGAIWGSD